MDWYESILRPAGLCPVLESASPNTVCIGIVGLGLEEQHDPARTPVRWVTAAGWGNPNADLYVVGTTPKFHSAAVAGPNYAPLKVDREAHAHWFATIGFARFLASSGAAIRETTRWANALVDAWTGEGKPVSEAAFFPELMLCPQDRDPSPSQHAEAYRQCMSRHLFKLLRDRPGGAPTLVLFGQKVAVAMYSGLDVDGPVPSRSQPVVVRPPDESLAAPVIASQAVMGAKMARLTQSAWVRAVIDARGSLRGR